MPRYTQYTHKVSIPIRKELHDFLDNLPHGIKSKIARTFLTKAHRIIERAEHNGLSPETINKLTIGNYEIKLEVTDDKPQRSQV